MSVSKRAEREDLSRICRPVPVSSHRGRATDSETDTSGAHKLSIGTTFAGKRNHGTEYCTTGREFSFLPRQRAPPMVLCALTSACMCHWRDIRCSGVREASAIEISRAPVGAPFQEAPLYTILFFRVSVLMVVFFRCAPVSLVGGARQASDSRATPWPEAGTNFTDRERSLIPP